MVRLLAILCLVAALATGQRAGAHAQLVAAEPAAGAVVAQMPPEVVLRFNEPVAPLVIRWIAPDAEPAETGAAADGMVLVVEVPEGLGGGTHVVSWRAVSADGHPVAGRHVFSVGTPSVDGAAGGAAGVAEGPAGGTAVAAAVARGLLNLALVAGIGGAVFLRLVIRGAHPARPAVLVARAGAWLVPGIALAALGLHGLDMLGAPVAALAGTRPWAAALASPVALTAGLAALAGVLAVAALRRTGAAGAGLARAAWAGAALSFAVSGHAAAAPPVWLTAPAVAVHAAAVLYWLGALPGIAVLARAGTPGLAPLLHRFSRLATPLVALLALSGAVLAVVQLGGVTPRLDTGYGRLLAVKLGAVALLLALAARNRLRLTPAIAAGVAGAPGRLRRSVLAEIGLGLVILGLAAGFRLTPPPRAVEVVVPGVHVHLHGLQVMADVTLRPGRAGANAAEVLVLDEYFRPFAPMEVRLAVSDPERGIARVTVAAEADGAAWRAPVDLPAGGRWVVRVEVLISDVERAVMEGEVTLPD